MHKNFITITYVGIGTWRPYTICRYSLYSSNLMGGLYCIQETEYFQFRYFAIVLNFLIVGTRKNAIY